MRVYTAIRLPFLFHILTISSKLLFSGDSMRIFIKLDRLSSVKAHTISNKLVSKVSAQKKGGESYGSYKYVFKFRWFQV